MRIRTERQKGYFASFLEELFPKMKEAMPPENSVSVAIEHDGNMEGRLIFLILGSEEYIQDILYYPDKTTIDMVIKTEEDVYGRMTLSLRLECLNRFYEVTVSPEEAALQEEILEVLSTNSDIHIWVTNQDKDMVKSFRMRWNALDAEEFEEFIIDDDMYHFLN